MYVYAHIHICIYMCKYTCLLIYSFIHLFMYLVAFGLLAARLTSQEIRLPRMVRGFVARISVFSHQPARFKKTVGFCGV